MKMFGNFFSREPKPPVEEHLVAKHFDPIQALEETNKKILELEEFKKSDNFTAEDGHDLTRLYERRDNLRRTIDNGVGV